MSYLKGDFTLDPKLEIKKVVLNVNDLNIMKKYYTLAFGMQVISETDQKVCLGTKGNNVLLELIKTDKNLVKDATGLYHVAYLIKTMEQFSALFKHLVQIQLPLGAADHGYSYALYTQDPEGNGIEIYHDLEREHWDVKDDGEIIGKTDPLPADKLLEMDTHQFEVLYEDAKIGHVHLRTHSLIPDRDFYVNVLGFEQKTMVGNTATFLATGPYHHHIALNVWEGENLPNRLSDDLGIKEIHFEVSNNDELSKLNDNIKKHNVEVNKSESELNLIDPNNIELYFHDEK